jgi:DNA-binding transcriptional LysR family regulator
MALQQLRYFVTVAESLSFTDAANEHFVAQSAISKQIGNLEKQLGVQLLYRNKRSVQLTNAGEYLLMEAKKLIECYETTIENTRKAANGQIGNIKVGLFGPEKDFLPKVINHFNKKYPRIDIDLLQLPREKINESLKNGEIDFGFTLSYSLNQIPNIEWQNIKNIPLNVFLHCDHPLAHNEKISIAAIANEPIITIKEDVSPTGYSHLCKLFDDHGFTPNVIKQCSRFETVLLLVEAGMGIAVLPKIIMEPHSTLRFIPFEESIEDFELVMAWNKHNRNNSLTLFLKEFESYFHEILPGFVCGLE